MCPGVFIGPQKFKPGHESLRTHCRVILSQAIIKEVPVWSTGLFGVIEYGDSVAAPFDEVLPGF